MQKKTRNITVFGTTITRKLVTIRWDPLRQFHVMQISTARILLARGCFIAPLEKRRMYKMYSMHVIQKVHKYVSSSQ